VKKNQQGMKKIYLPFLLLFTINYSVAQESREKVERACLDYIEGFYEGDTTKLINCLKPSLYKFGFWKKDKESKYEPDGYMTYRQALDYAKRVLEKKKFAKPESPKKVEVLDVMNNIASAKITAWWGIDYILLSKRDDQWMIEEVLWEGPLQKSDMN
jgi:hypothetical protein